MKLQKKCRNEIANGYHLAMMLDPTLLGYLLACVIPTHKPEKLITKGR